MLFCLSITAALHIFTAIYSISSWQNLLFTCFASSSCQPGFFVFFAFVWSKQPNILVFAVQLAVGTFSDSLLFLDFLRALFLCPWTNAPVFAGFGSFFQLELLWPKMRFWIFTEIHSFDDLFLGVVGGSDKYVHSDFRHGKLINDFN